MKGKLLNGAGIIIISKNDQELDNLFKTIHELMEDGSPPTPDQLDQRPVYSVNQLHGVDLHSPHH